MIIIQKKRDIRISGSRLSTVIREPLKRGDVSSNWHLNKDRQISSLERYLRKGILTTGMNNYQGSEWIQFMWEVKWGLQSWSEPWRGEQQSQSRNVISFAHLHKDLGLYSGKVLKSLECLKTKSHIIYLVFSQDHSGFLVETLKRGKDVSREDTGRPSGKCNNTSVKWEWAGVWRTHCNWEQLVKFWIHFEGRMKMLPISYSVKNKKE